MKTIIFDMYGVILKDPTGGLMPYLNGIFPDLTYDDVYYPHWVDGCVGELSSLDFFRNMGFAGDLKKAERDYLDTIEIDEAFLEVVQEIKERYRLALLSNDLSEWSGYLREKYGLNDLFEEIIVSGDVKMRKPDARIFALMLERLGQEAADCIFIDDRRGNLLAARSLGMDAILFNGGDVDYDEKRVSGFHELADMLRGNVCG